MPTQAVQSQATIPPRYTIDLSLPPHLRYKELAADYKTQLNALTGLFDQLLIDLTLPPSWLPAVNRVSKLLLRKVHDSEQTRELRGISRETGIPMYLIVAFNVVLDLLMGCTSGAVRSLEANQPRTQATMLHFRTLDWTMDPLRLVVVQLDFVRSNSATPEKLLASSITYAGFVGVLTGVTQGLSMSLNFRGVHNARTRSAHFRFYFHHLLVLLGRRPSIASILRHYLITDSQKSEREPWHPDAVVMDLQRKHTTAAYIILSDGNSTVTMEKDYATAKVQQSDSFIAITNHDKQEHVGTERPTPATNGLNGAAISGIEEIIQESTERLQCIQRKWDARVARASRRSTRMRSKNNGTSKDVCITRSELIEWLCDWPTTNECTHYAAVLDPSAGEVAWSRAYHEPLQGPIANTS